MDEKLYRTLTARMASISFEVFTSPPKTMEEFNLRRGRWEELRQITEQMALDARGIEKD